MGKCPLEVCQGRHAVSRNQADCQGLLPKKAKVPLDCAQLYLSTRGGWMSFESPPFLKRKGSLLGRARLDHDPDFWRAAACGNAPLSDFDQRAAGYYEHVAPTAYDYELIWSTHGLLKTQRTNQQQHVAPALIMNIFVNPFLLLLCQSFCQSFMFYEHFVNPFVSFDHESLCQPSFLSCSDRGPQECMRHFTSPME